MEEMLPIPESKQYLTSRRTYLAGLAATSIPAMAGCAAVTEREFVAGNVYMLPDVLTSLDYHEIKRDVISSIEEGRAYGLTVNPRLTSNVAVYEKTVETEQTGEGADRLTVGAIASPLAVMLRNVQNPLATLSRSQMLVDDRSTWYMHQAGFEDIGEAWSRGPTFLGNNRARFLGRPTRLYSSWAGILGEGSDAKVAFAHFQRQESGDDIVIGLAVRSWAVDDTGLPFVDEDGYISEEELEMDVETVNVAFESLRHE